MAFFDHNHSPDGTVDLLLETTSRHLILFAKFEFWLVSSCTLMP